MMANKERNGLLESDIPIDNLDELINIYRPPAIALALNILGNREDAEDVCQEMFVSAFRNMPSCPFPPMTKKWLFTILYRKCMDILRKRKRSIRLASKIRDENPAQLFHNANPDRDSQQNRKLSLSRTLLSALSNKERACLSLWANEDYTSEEIAGILCCSPSTVRVHLFKARRKIKTIMENDDVSL